MVFVCSTSLVRYSLPRPLLAGGRAAVERPDEMTVEDTLLTGAADMRKQYRPLTALKFHLLF